jgi:hypothetical protein
MDAGTAKLPSVVWAGVMGGKRVYLARAVRYVRDLLCGSFEQDEEARYIPAEFAGPRGWSAGILAASSWEEHAVYGPLPDAAELEELWLVVDGVRTIINLPSNGLLRPIIDAAVNYYIGNRAPDKGYYREDKHKMMLSAEQYEKAAIRDRWLEEPVGHGGTFNTIAQISSTDVLVLLFPANLGAAKSEMIYTVMRINTATGATTTAYSGPAPTTGYPGNFAALTCYQHEIIENGETVISAHLFWSNTLHPDGEIAISVDSGVSWLPAFINPASSEFDPPGMAGLGIHIGGQSFDSGMRDPSSPFYRRKPLE